MPSINFIVLPRGAVDLSALASASDSDNLTFADSPNFLTWSDLPLVFAFGVIFVFFVYLSVKESRRIHNASNPKRHESATRGKGAWSSSETLVNGQGSAWQGHDEYVVYWSSLLRILRSTA
ncbi:hypothetical protein C8R45DRAFT_919307 [Mycena sanguinolenta]|nr:hypothetical protein C8R45DRAFT_919307 [Mycena sanguinolenta]